MHIQILKQFFVKVVFFSKKKLASWLAIQFWGYIPTRRVTCISRHLEDGRRREREGIEGWLMCQNLIPSEEENRKLKSVDTILWYVEIGIESS
jgi:hypothetical protein